eukprot:7313080-Ditylum_brightwellii.AAC.1
MKDYLGINISKIVDKIKLSQPHIINHIQCQVGLDPRKRHKSTLTPSTKILHRAQKAPAFNKQFHYCLFSEDLCSTHTEAVKYLASYLAGTRNLGIMLNPDKEQSFEVYADTDFIRN